MKEVTQGFWEHYTADEPDHSDVHLLPYPITVDECGEVTNLEEPWNCVSILMFSFFNLKIYVSPFLTLLTLSN